MCGPIPDDLSVKFFNHQTLSYGIACSFNNSHFRAERSNDPNSNLKEAVYFLKKNLINGGSISFVVTITISTIVGNMYLLCNISLENNIFHRLKGDKKNHTPNFMRGAKHRSEEERERERMSREVLN